MTDNEIIKALECCMNGHCDDECPFRKTREHCQNLDSLILDLINRQKAEIERLKDDNKFLQDNRWKELSFVKAEAYKEFAKRLKEKFAIAIIKNISVEFALGYKTAFIDITNNIDNLLKELVGENK